MKQTRMKRHQEKIRATNRRKKRIFATVTTIGLVCPATLGSMQAMADEITPQTELTTEQQTPAPATEATNDTANQTQPVPDNVTQEQPASETPSQTPVAPIQPQTEIPSQETITPEPAPTETAPIQAEQPTVETPAVEKEPEEASKAEETTSTQDNASELLEQWEEMVGYMNQITPVLDEIQSKVAGTEFQAKYDELSGVMAIIHNIGGDMPPEQREQSFYDYWIPELQRVLSETNQLRDEVNQSDQSANLAKWQADMSAIEAILTELDSEITVTSHRDRHNELYIRWVDASDAGRDTPEKDQAFFDQWLPELQSLLNESNQLKADVEASQTEDIYTYYVIQNVVDDNGNIVDSTRWPETAVKDTFVEIKAVNWYGYFLVPGSPSEYPATQITQDETQEFVFTYMSASSEKYRDPAKDKQIEDWLTEIYDLYFELEPKAKGTKYEAQLKHLWEEADVVGVSQGMIMQSSGILAWYDYAYTNIPPILAEMKALADEINNQPSETVNYTIRCLDEFGSPIAGVSDITKSAKKGASITEKAPKVEGYFIPKTNLNEITQTIGDNTVFEFRYSNHPVISNIYLEIVGSTTAKTGESKTYQLLEEKYWNDPAKDSKQMLDFPTVHGKLVSSDPSDVITNGTIVFRKAGKRTLEVDGLGVILVVTVTDAGVTPPTPEKVDKSGLEEAIKKGEEAIKAGNWEDDSNLKKLIEDGKKILADDKATQDQVDLASKQITDAISNLKPKHDSTGGTDNQENNTNGGSNNGSGSNASDQNTDKGVNSNNSANRKTTVTNVNSKTTQANSSGKDNLPQAGEDVSSSTMLAVAGLTLAGFSTAGILKRRRKA